MLDQSSSAWPCALAEHLFLRRHSAAGLLDRLEERGLVERVRGDDRWQVRVRLTAEGEHLLKRLSRAHREELRSSGPTLVGLKHEARGLPPRQRHERLIVDPEAAIVGHELEVVGGLQLLPGRESAVFDVS